MSKPPQWVTINDFAKHWGVTRGTVYRWMHENRVSFKFAPSGRIRIDINSKYEPEKVKPKKKRMPK